jgi:succinyl-diaminopimelate desuccinylase
MIAGDKKRLLSLAKKLISTNSENPPGREKEVAKVLRDHLEAHGISTKSVGSSERPSLIFSTKENFNGQLVLHGHMDTVPAGERETWKYDPFEAKIVGNRLFGRGACDMKGPLAALAETMILYSHKDFNKPLLLLATSDEETTCNGAAEVADSGLLEEVKFGICAEPTSLKVLVGEKGLLWCRVIARGKAAHGSTPEMGENAIELCMDALRALQEEEYPYTQNELMGHPTANIGTIKGGNKINVVPESCEARIDMRLVKDQNPKEILEQMNLRLKNEGLSNKVQVELLRAKPTVFTPRDSEIVTVTMNAAEAITGTKSEPSVATFGTDCSELQPKLGILNVICGPGSIKLAHQANEFINIDELLSAVKVFYSVAQHFSN